MKMRFGLLALAAMLAATPSPAAEIPGVTSDEILVGSVGPMTGPVYVYGLMSMNGMDVVFDKVNKEGGIHGRKIRMVREDDRCNPEGAISAVRRLIYDHKVFAIIGGACTAATLAAKPEIVRSEIPTVISIAAGNDLSAPPEKNIYAVIAVSKLEGAAQVRLAQEGGGKEVAVIAQHDAWGNPRYSSIMEEIKKAGLTVVADERIADDANDATAQALRLRESGAKTVLVLARPKAAAVLLRDAVKVGYKPERWIGQSAMMDLDAFDQQVGIPGALDNFLAISLIKHQPSDPEMADWGARARGLYPSEEFSTFNLVGISGALVLVEALKRAGPDLDRESFLEAMGSIKGFDTGIIAGTINCQPMVDHQCARGFAWVKKTSAGIETVTTTIFE